MSWMAWTLPTALFFAGIGLMLVVMTLWELKSPTALRRGFLPMATTRGDRVFISLLAAAFLHLIVLGVTGLPILVASGCAVILAVVLMRWG